MINQKQGVDTFRLALSGIVMALYVIIMFLTQSFAFGQFQIRIATSVYALSAIYPFLIIPLGLSNMLSNMVMGGLGIFDVLGGFLVGVTTSYLIHLISHRNLGDWLIAMPIILVPGLVVPIWLSIIIEVPYTVLAASVLIGQIIPGIVGVLLVKKLKSRQ